MVNKSIHNVSREIDGGPPPLDESWWEAVLAEEDARNHPPENSVEYPVAIKEPALASNSEALLVDWDYAVELFTQDKVVELDVTGHNRGGLLVSGDRLQGFVPISHLVDIQLDTPEADPEQTLASFLDTRLRLKIIECDQERGRVVFSQRAAQAAPGSRVQLLNSLTPHECVEGKVTNITDFGVFVDLGGVEGLIHVSELSWGRVRHPADVISYNKTVQVYVISVDPDRSRVALSIKRLHPNPWTTAETRYQPGQIAEAIITSIVPFGAFARLEEGLDGLIHVSEIIAKDDDQTVSDLLYEGQPVKVRILHVDTANQRLGLSLVLDAD